MRWRAIPGNHLDGDGVGIGCLGANWAVRRLLAAVLRPVSRRHIAEGSRYHGTTCGRVALQGTAAQRCHRCSAA